jgi:ribokinase
MGKTRKSIIVVGSITMDLVTRTPRIPSIGQTLIGTGFETTPGGKGANQAVAASRLGYPVAVVGKVGTDVYGPALIENLAHAGVDTSAITQTEGSSGLAPIFLDENGNNSIVVIPGANGKLDHEAIDWHEDRIRSAGMVLCQLEIPIDTLTYTLALCAKAGVPVMLDPAPAATLPEQVFQQVAWFTPNESEAAFYAGNSASAEESAEQLLALGLRGVALKRGAEGAFLATQEGIRAWVPAFSVPAVDTVAAGDCWNAAFAVALLEDNNPLEAARFAAAAAALSVTRRGAQNAMPTRVEVDAFLAARR